MNRLTRRDLNGLRVVSLLDGVLLVALVYAAVRGPHEAVAVLGPTHGLLYLLLVVSLAAAAWRGRLRWRFVAAVMVLGPLASVPGLELYRGRRERGAIGSLLGLGPR